MSTNATEPEKMPTEIVVGVDGSTGSAHALGWAISFAAGHPGTVIQPVVAWETLLLDKGNPFAKDYPSGGHVHDRAVLHAAATIDPVVDRSIAADRAALWARREYPTRGAHPSARG